MDLIGEIKRRAGKVVGPVLCLLIVAYFVYGTVQGDRGLFAYFSMSQELTRAQNTLNDLRRTRLGLEQRVALLRPESLDLDLLEERARIVLDFVNPDDFVLVLPPITQNQN
jgi:cell division protein FtsB